MPNSQNTNTQHINSALKNTNLDTVKKSNNNNNNSAGNIPTPPSIPIPTNHTKTPIYQQIPTESIQLQNNERIQETTK